MQPRHQSRMTRKAILPPLKDGGLRAVSCALARSGAG